MKLSDYARIRKVTYRTAWNRYKRGQIPGAYQEPNGQITVPESALSPMELKIKEPETHLVPRAVLYARVSDPKKKDQLDRQAERLKTFATSNGYTIVRIGKERGSGLNDNRRVLNSILENSKDWDILIVEHKDRLTRYGYNHINLLLKQLGKQIIIINQVEDDTQDLMNDLISVVYSFSARLYGKRRKERAQLIVQTITGDNNE